MTEETARLDRAIEVNIVRIVARRMVPLFPLAIPRYRRLKQAAVVLDQIGNPSGARTEGVFHFPFDFREHPPGLIEPGLAVNLAAAVPVDGKAAGAGLESGGAVAAITTGGI